MLDDFQNRLMDAGWSVEPGDSISPDPTPGKVFWIARKNGCTVIVSDKGVSVARGSARSSTPLDVVKRGHILLPGALSERYLSAPVNRDDLVPHEGPMTAEEIELRALLG